MSALWLKIKGMKRYYGQLFLPDVLTLPSSWTSVLSAKGRERVYSLSLYISGHDQGY